MELVCLALALALVALAVADRQYLVMPLRRSGRFPIVHL